LTDTNKLLSYDDTTGLNIFLVMQSALFSKKVTQTSYLVRPGKAKPYLACLSNLTQTLYLQYKIVKTDTIIPCLSG